MSEARTSLNILIIPTGQDQDIRPVIEGLERLDKLEQIGIGELGVIERTNLGWLAPKSADDGRSLESLADVWETPDGVDPAEAAAALTFIGQHIPAGSQAIVAIVAEPETGSTVDNEMAKLGATVHRRAALEVFTDLEEAIDRQERRRTFRSRAEKKLDKVVKSRIREEMGPFKRLERAVTWPFDRLTERIDETER